MARRGAFNFLSRDLPPPCHDAGQRMRLARPAHDRASERFTRAAVSRMLGKQAGWQVIARRWRPACRHPPSGSFDGRGRGPEKGPTSHNLVYSDLLQTGPAKGAMQSDFRTAGERFFSISEVGDVNSRSFLLPSIERGE